MEYVGERSIIKLGSGLAVLTTKELRKMKKKMKDKVHIFFDSGRIIISTENNIVSALKPFGIPKDTWREFLSFAIRKNKNMEVQNAIETELKEAIEEYVTTEITVFGKTLIKSKKK